MKSTDCPCCAARKNNPVIYLHLPQNEDTIVTEESGEIRPIFYLENSNNKSLPTLQMISNIEISVANCERCKKILECSNKLQRSVPNLNEKDIINVCNHCGFVNKYKEGCSCCKKKVELCVDKKQTKSLDFDETIICDYRNSSLKFKNRSYSDSNIHESIKFDKYFFGIKRKEEKAPNNLKSDEVSKININKKEVTNISLSTLLLNQYSNTIIGKKSIINKHKSYSELDLDTNYNEYLSAQAENTKRMKITATDLIKNSHIMEDKIEIGIDEKGKTRFFEAIQDQNHGAVKHKIINEKNNQRNMSQKHYSSFLSIKSTPKDYEATGKTKFLEAVRDQNLGAKKYETIKKKTIDGNLPEEHHLSFLSIKSIPKDYDADDLEYFFPKEKKKEPQSTMVPSSEIISDIYNKLQTKLQKEQEAKEEYLKSLKNKEIKSIKKTTQKGTSNEVLEADKTKDSNFKEKEKENLNGDKTDSKQAFDESYANNSKSNLKQNKQSEMVIKTKTPKTGQRQTTSESLKEKMSDQMTKQNLSIKPEPKRDYHLVQTGVENKKEVELKNMDKQNKGLPKINEKEKLTEQQPKIKLDSEGTEIKSTNKNKTEVDSKLNPPEQKTKIKTDSNVAEVKSTNKNKTEVDSKLNPPKQQTKIKIDSKVAEVKSTHKNKTEVDSKLNPPEQQTKIKIDSKVAEVKSTKNKMEVNSKLKPPEQQFRAKPGSKTTEIKNEKDVDSKSKPAEQQSKIKMGTKVTANTTNKNEKQVDSKLKPKEQQSEIKLDLKDKSSKATKDSKKPAEIEVKIKEYNILKKSQKGDKSEDRDKKREKKEILTPSFDVLDLENIDSDLSESDEMLKKIEVKFTDAIIGEKVVKFNPLYGDKTLVNGNRVLQKEPLLFISDYKEDYLDFNCKEMIDSVSEGIKTKTVNDQELPKGMTRYALSDRSFIEKGWTILPMEKVVRKINVYRMRPAHPEFDWFAHNKAKQTMTFDSGEKLAEFDDNGRGRWFYRNGRLALDYYDAAEINAQQRFVVYSSGEPDERGRTHPITVLATFDYLGNGVVFDHRGKIRLKYNQTEGILLDRSIGPVSHWKWHTLNDPPVLQQVMIDTQMAHKDPDILKLGGPNADKPRPDNEEMLAIEFENFVKEKSKKLSQKFKPFQIKMKALKINNNFSLRVLDQASVYLIFRDGSTNLKLNIGMILDHQEIVDTDTAEVGEVSNNVERLPALTDSIAGLQKSIANAQSIDRNRVERDQRIRPTVPVASADLLVAGTSRGLRPTLKTFMPPVKSSVSHDCPCRTRNPCCTTNLYYNTRLI